ncbi:hypothetical protein [Bacteroides rodentium]
MNKQRISLCLLASLMGLAAAGCSDDVATGTTPVPPDGEERITVTASAGMPQGGPDTRVDFEENADDKKLEITWRDPADVTKGNPETFSVLGGADAAAPATFTLTELGTNAHNGTFTGEITPKENTTYYAVYPELKLPESTTTARATAISLDMTGQTGDKPDESKLYMFGTSAYSASNRKLDFSFKHLTSILKVTLQFPAESGSGTPDMDITPLTRANAGASVSDVTFSASSGLASKATVDITQATGADGTLPSAAYTSTAGSLVLSKAFTLSTDATPSVTVYLHVLPGDLKNLTVTTKVGTGDAAKGYGCILSTSPTLAAGKMYTATAEMEVLPSYTVTTTVAPGSDNYYIDRELQIGTTTAEGTPVVLGSATVGNDGKAVVPSVALLAADTKFWVCIPGVVKFFHTLTADELSSKAITLPDKDGGSTLKTSPTISTNGKAYENDWIVALYMGVNKNGAATSGTGDGAVPLYWATGNIIATKTNDAKAVDGDASYITTASFHIATADETKAEGTTSDKTTPYGAAPSSESATDGYTSCALGSQWNMFGFGDASGLKTSETVGDYAPSFTTTGQSICGNADYDIARKQLGGSWRLPAVDYTTGNEFAAFADNSNKNLPPDGENWEENSTYFGRKYTYTISDAGGSSGNSITNTLAFPAAGYRGGKDVNDRGSFGYCRSGTVYDSDDVYDLNFYKNSAGWRSGYRYYGESVRPVSE